MSLQANLQAVKDKLAALEANYAAVKADLEAQEAAIAAEVAALPSDIAGKTDADLAALYHKIEAYFGGAANVPPEVVPPAPVELSVPAV